MNKLTNNPKTLDSNFRKLLMSSKFNLTERKVGKYQIKIDVIPQGEPITVVSFRNCFMMGYKPLKVVCQLPPTKPVACDDSNKATVD